MGIFTVNVLGYLILAIAGLLFFGFLLSSTWIAATGELGAVWLAIAALALAGGLLLYFRQPKHKRRPRL